MPKSLPEKDRKDREIAIRMMISKHMTLRQIGDALGVTPERIRQIASVHGWKTTGIKGRPKKVTLVNMICKRKTCKKPFTYAKPHRRVYCSDACFAILREMGKGCWACHKMQSELTDILMKAGRFKNGNQRWICHACSNARYKKYGTYSTPENLSKAQRKWYLKNKDKVMEKARTRYHLKECKCPEHVAARAK